MERLHSETDTIRFRNFVRAGVDTGWLMAHYDKTKFAGAPLLVALKASFPDRLHNRQLQDSDDLDFFNVMTGFAVDINDAVDLLPFAVDAQHQCIVDAIVSRYNRGKQKLLQFAGTDGRKQRVVRDFVSDYIAVEMHARSKPESEWDVSEAVKHRSITSALTMTYITAGLFGPSELDTRLFSPPADPTFASWRDAYRWLIDGEVVNETERKLHTLFPIVMCTQIIDDSLDIESDRRLGLHTIATEVLRETNNDHSHAHRILKKMRDEYVRHALQSGASSVMINTVLGVYWCFKRFINSQTEPKFGLIRESLMSQIPVS